MRSAPVNVQSNDSYSDGGDRLLSVEQARAKLGLGRTKFYSLIEAKVLSPKRIGRRTLFRLSDIEVFLKSL